MGSRRTPSRNDPCPCGSGKKYKRCCQGTAAARPSARTEPEFAQAALGHLHRRHRRAFEVTVDEFFGCIEDYELPELASGLQQMLEINLYEWALAEGEISVGGSTKRVVDLLTSDRGPRLSVEQRGALIELGKRPLRLYEVVATDPGASIVVRDVVQAPAEPVEVRERTASRSLAVGDLIGLRLVRSQLDEAWILTGAAYPLPRVWLQPLREEIRDIEERFHPNDVPALVSDSVIRSWLEHIDPSPPSIVDRATGEAILLTTDHYRVVDRANLLARLEAAPGLDGDAESGWRCVEDSTHRVLWSARLKGDHFQVFSHTRSRGDENRAWFEEVLGDAVTFTAREHTDPTSEALSGGDSLSTEEPPEVPPELWEELYRRNYSDWADAPIPALHDQTPREVVATETGRERVAELLLSYEHSERQQASSQGRPIVSFQFLWDELELKRPPTALDP